MPRFFLTFLTFSILLLCGCANSMKNQVVIIEGKDIFQQELSDIYAQQFAIRRTQWLSALQHENRNANTLAAINQLELMLENPDLDNAGKNQILAQHFLRASLYMQILLFPDNRETSLQNQIKNELFFELSSIFLHRTLAEEFLTKSHYLPASDAVKTLQSQWQNIISNQQIEYNALFINDLNSSRKIPYLEYPLNIIPHFGNLEEFRKYHYTPARDAAMKIYPALSAAHSGNLPLVLLKLMYKTPYELNNHYSNDPQLKKDFYDLISELVWLYQSSQLYSNMQNAFIIAQDFQKSLTPNNKISPEMLDGCIKSQLAYELALLKMFTKTSLSPFNKNQLPTDNVKQLPSSRTETLQLILKDILEKI